MAIGAKVRGMLPAGWDRRAAEVYRRRFIDLDDFGRTVARLGSFTTIAEVGCGDGAMTTRLAQHFPDARITAIDVAPTPGGQYEGDPAQVTFASRTVAELVAGSAGAFDLVLVVDVLHHVPMDERDALLRDCRRLLRPGGVMLVKEWERRANLIGFVAGASDRYITGDRGVSFWTRDELLDALGAACPGDPVILESRVPPNRNNLAVALRAES